MAVVCSSTSSEVNLTSSIYSLIIDINPTISSTTGGNFTVQIYYDSLNALHTASGTTDLDFSFMGLCQSQVNNVIPAAILNYCQISSDLSTITFSVNSVVANTPIRIATQINNPLYYSTRGIRSYWT